MTIPFLQDSTFTGLISTLNHGTSQQWYEAFNTVSLFIQTSAINVQNTTFDSLTALKSSNGLIPGTFYQINDFELKWKSQGYYDPEPFKSSGVIEPLIVFAVTLSSISPIAYSTLHSNDIVFYNIDATTSTGWGDFPGPGTTVPGIKGWITRRIDQVRNIDIGWDWRYITSNCCKFNVESLPLYNTGTSYNEKAVVRTSAGKIYYSTKNNNINNAVTNLTWWAPFSNLTSEVDMFFPTNEVSYGAFFNNPIVTLTPILSTRTQLPTFPDANSTNIKDVKIISGFNNYFNGSLIFKSCNIGSNFHNNFITTYVGFGDGFEGNIINNNFSSNIIGHAFSNNIIKNNFRYNICVGSSTGVSPAAIRFCSIGNSFELNHINYQFANNIINDGFYSNIIRRNFTSNVIGNTCQNNNVDTFSSFNFIGNDCKNNKIDTGFVYNTIGNTTLNNIIGNTFAYNKITNNMFNNIFGNGISNNTLDDDFTFNVVGDGFYSNRVAAFCGGNTFGESFATNTIGYQFTNNTFGTNVNNNKFGNSVDSLITGFGFTYTTVEDAIQNVDFSSATHVYNGYNKTIFNNAASVIRLSYYNSSDQLVVTDPES